MTDKLPRRGLLSAAAVIGWGADLVAQAAAQPARTPNPGSIVVTLLGTGSPP